MYGTSGSLKTAFSGAAAVAIVPLAAAPASAIDIWTPYDGRKYLVTTRA